MDSKLNRNYRVLWSEARRQWVVADELASAGGKGKSCGAVSKLLCAALVAGGLLASGPEDASALSGSCGTGISANISAVLNGTCTATATDAITLTNSGTIQAGIAPGTVHVLSTLASPATGVSIDNSGKILNTTLSAIFIDAAATGTTITNQVGGQISATAPSATRRLLTAISYVGDLDAASSLSNSGTISIMATRKNTSSVTARGVKIGGDLLGTLTNGGTISATATLNGFTSSPSPVAYGVEILGVLSSGTLANTGTISATAINHAVNVASSSNLNVTAYGVAAFTTLSGMLTNSGTISATATNTGLDVASSSISIAAQGVRATALSGTLTNTGMISAAANNSGTAIRSFIRASGYGVSLGTLSGTLDNQGTISASATNNGNASSSTSNVIIAYGVNVAGVTSGALTNSGSISASASNGGSGRSHSVSVFGVRLATLSGTGSFTNSGTISASASGTKASSTLSAFGVRIFVMQTGAVFTNSGTISATTNQPGDIAGSLNIRNGFGSTAGTVNNLAGGVLRGNLAILNPLVPVNNAGTIDIPDGPIALPVSSIAGNYTQQTGGMLRIGASSTISYGKLPVTGTADLSASGALDVNVSSANTLAKGQVLTGVLTAGVLTPPTGVFTVTDNSPLMDFTAAVNLAGTGVDLTAVAPAVPGVALALNGVAPFAFNSTTNNVMTLTATTAASNPVANADVYVALKLPDGTLLVMQPDGSFSTTLTALASNIPVPDFNGAIFNFTFTGTEPPGNYTWFAALTTPGSLNVISTLATVPFSFAP